MRVDDFLGGVGVRTHPEPDHVGDRQVAEGEPQHHEQQHGGELDALGKGADDQAAGDGGEGGLESQRTAISGMTTPLLKVAAFAEVPVGGSNMPFMNSAVEAADDRRCLR
jgi:hypothetical protein